MNMQLENQDNNKKLIKFVTISKIYMHLLFKAMTYVSLSKECATEVQWSSS